MSAGGIKRAVAQATLALPAHAFMNISQALSTSNASARDINSFFEHRRSQRYLTLAV